jgi:hypothetical protein
MSTPRDPFATPDSAIQPYRDDPSHLNVGSTVSETCLTSYLFLLIPATTFLTLHSSLPVLSLQLGVHPVNVVQHPTRLIPITILVYFLRTPTQTQQIISQISQPPWHRRIATLTLIRGGKGTTQAVKAGASGSYVSLPFSPCLPDDSNVPHT